MNNLQLIDCDAPKTLKSVPFLIFTNGLQNSWMYEKSINNNPKLLIIETALKRETKRQRKKNQYNQVYLVSTNCLFVMLNNSK